MLPMPAARLERTNKGNLSEPSGQEQQRRDVSSRLSAGTDAEVQKDHAASTADTVPLDVDDAACVVCNSMDDDSNMLLCDGCDDGYHIYCCTPKLSEIPDGDWFCEECRPSKKARHQETEDQPPSSQIQERSTHGPSATDTGGQNMAERVTQDGEKQSIEPVVVDQYASLEATQELSGSAEPGTSGGLPDGGLPDVKISEDLHTDSSDTMTDPLLSAAPPPPPSRPPHGWVPRESTAGCDESLNTPFVDSLEFTAAEGWVSRSHRDLGLGMAASTKNAMVLSVHSRRIAVPAPGVSQQSDSNVIVAPLAPSLSATDDSQRKVSIVCPESFKEGDELEVAVPGRPLRIVAVTVPEGIAAGNLFYVRLPFNLVTASDDEQNSEDECQDKLRGHTQNKRKKEKSRSESSECPGSSNDGDGAPTRQAETGAEIVIATLGSECALGSCSPASNTHGAEY